MKDWYLFFNAMAALANSDAILFGTHAQRVAQKTGGLADGVLYVETDRQELVYQTQGGVWKYVSGTYQRTQAQLAALAATLTANDNGLRVNVTDYAHVLLWTNPAWGWAPEDPQNAGQICFFDVAPGTGWKLIDGNGDDGSAIGAGHPIKILKSDGTTRNNTTAAAMNAGVYLRGAAAYNGAVVAATVPTISGSTASAVTGASILGTTGGPSATVSFPQGSIGSVTVASSTHTHSQGSLTDPGHTHAAGTLATSLAGGDPVAHTDALPYIRK